MIKRFFLAGFFLLGATPAFAQGVVIEGASVRPGIEVFPDVVPAPQQHGWPWNVPLSSDDWLRAAETAQRLRNSLPTEERRAARAGMPVPAPAPLPDVSPGVVRGQDLIVALPPVTGRGAVPDVPAAVPGNILAEQILRPQGPRAAIPAPMAFPETAYQPLASPPSAASPSAQQGRAVPRPLFRAVTQTSAAVPALASAAKADAMKVLDTGPQVLRLPESGRASEVKEFSPTAHSVSPSAADTLDIPLPPALPQPDRAALAKDSVPVIPEVDAAPPALSVLAAPPSTLMQTAPASPTRVEPPKTAELAQNLQAAGQNLAARAEPVMVPTPAQEAAVNAAPPAVPPPQEKNGVLVLSFAPSVESLSAENEKALKKFLTAFENAPGKRLQVEAKATQADGMSEREARRLSLMRALRVRGFLIEQGLDSAQMDIRALGVTPSDAADQVMLRVQ